MSTTSPASTPDATAAGRLEAGLGFRLGRAHRIVRGAWQAQIGDLGLSGAQASVLRAVAEHPGVGLRELARALGTDPMNAKRLADGLEAEGLLVSSADAGDRRLRVLEPTDAGLALASEVRQRALAWTATLEGLVGQADIAAVLAVLDRLEQSLAGAAPAHHEPTGGSRG